MKQLRSYQILCQDPNRNRGIAADNHGDVGEAQFQRLLQLDVSLLVTPYCIIPISCLQISHNTARTRIVNVWPGAILANWNGDPFTLNGKGRASVYHNVTLGKQTWTIFGYTRCAKMTPQHRRREAFFRSFQSARGQYNRDKYFRGAERFVLLADAEIHRWLELTEARYNQFLTELSSRHWYA